MFHVGAILSLTMVPFAGRAQEQTSTAQTQTQSSSGWHWASSGTAFFGFNDQQRKFRDFRKWESQNWLMATGDRPLGTGTLAIESMLSFEPFTMEKLGSPQVFQSGEAYRGAPLIDYQHPHDLLMELAAEYRRPLGSTLLRLSAALVGPAAFGPPVFMHRPSAADNPQVPLSHHYTDSTHTTNGVIGAGVGIRALRFDGSWFHGREPDDNRTDIDIGPPDSWSIQGSWGVGAWSAQVSGAKLHKPEALELVDQARLSASVSHRWSGARTTVDTTLAWGEHRDIHGNLDAYLAETHIQLSPRNAFYGRTELAAKDILDKGGLHPIGFRHPHRISRVAAFTAGYVRDIFETSRGRFGLGGDATTYWVAPNLRDSYGTPFSWHVFVRFRSVADSATEHAHVHGASH